MIPSGRCQKLRERVKLPKYYISYKKKNLLVERKGEEMWTLLSVETLIHSTDLLNVTMCRHSARYCGRKSNKNIVIKNSNKIKTLSLRNTDEKMYIISGIEDDL